MTTPTVMLIFRKIHAPTSNVVRIWPLYLFWVHPQIVPIMGTMRKAIYSLEYQRLTEWLKAVRQMRGWSMRELGEKLGEPHSFVQKVESMERRLDAFELVEYCRALEVDPREGLERLINGTDNKSLGPSNN